MDVFQNHGGPNGNLMQPLLLILGVPNNGGSSIFGSVPISGVTFINPYPGGTSTAGTAAFATAGTFNLKAAVSPGYFGNMIAGQEVYSFLTLGGPVNNSNSFTNWSGADSTINSITATNFGIYVIALTSSVSLGPKGLINFTATGLPLGTFVVAYGHNSQPNSAAFTEAGLTAGSITTPEPGSMALFGTGLLILGGAIRRRWSKRQV